MFIRTVHLSTCITEAFFFNKHRCQFNTEIHNWSVCRILIKKTVKYTVLNEICIALPPTFTARLRFHLTGRSGKIVRGRDSDICSKIEFVGLDRAIARDLTTLGCMHGIYTRSS